MKNRYHPFGYAVRNGVLGVVSEEAATVRRIFRAYVNGASYQGIADRLSHGAVAYNGGTPTWNKHMVKRILENEKYLGRPPYEALATQEMFDHVALIRADKGWEYSLPPEQLKALKHTVHCARCGAPLLRIQKGKPAQWVCTGEDCAVTFTDDYRLSDGIVKLLNILIANPATIEIPQADIAIQSVELIRLNSGIIRQLESRDCDETQSLMLIMKAAAEKYDLSDDGGLSAAGKQLRELLGGHPPLDDFDAELFGTAVRQVMAGTDGSLQLALANGQRFPTSGEEMNIQ